MGSLKSQYRNVILSRGLPKTGQTTAYDANDDGVLEIGWWHKLFIANNKNRFRIEIINGDTIVFDYATGLMWPKDWDSDATDNLNRKSWADAIAFCESLSFADFNDWFLPNFTQLFPLCDFETSNPAAYSIFENVQYNLASKRYFTSTTYNLDTSKAYLIRFAAPNTNILLKTGTYFFVPCRVWKI